MQGILFIHIAAGGLALVVGYVALFSAKGARVHRQTGTVFVYAMITMGATATVIAAVRGIQATLLGGALATYMVVTALTTVRPASRRVELLLTLMGSALVVGMFSTAFEALGRPDGRLDGVPAFPAFMNATIGLLAVTGDLRVLRNGALRGARRLARHMWRMCFALFIAAGSFFLGQADELPKALRIMPLLTLPVLAVIIAMLYWFWRLRSKRSLPGIVASFAHALSREPTGEVNVHA